ARHLRETPFAIVAAADRALAVELVELERKLAPIRGADRLHQLDEIHRPGLERLAHRLKARLELQARREGFAIVDDIGALRLRVRSKPALVICPPSPVGSIDRAKCPGSLTTSLSMRKRVANAHSIDSSE